MPNILSSIATNGWRETFYILFHEDNRVLKQPYQSRLKYVRIRHRKRNGRKTRATAYQLMAETDEERGELKTYRRVDDGHPPDNDEIQELITGKKSVVMDNQRSQRPGREGRKRRRRAQEEPRSDADSLPTSEHSQNERQSPSQPRKRHPRTTLDATSNAIESGTDGAQNTKKKSIRIISALNTDGVESKILPNASLSRPKQMQSIASDYVRLPVNLEGETIGRTKRKKKSPPHHSKPQETAHSNRSSDRGEVPGRDTASVLTEMRYVYNAGHNAGVIADPLVATADQDRVPKAKLREGPANSSDRTEDENEPGSPSSFHQPQMDDRDSQSFVFGNMRDALALTSKSSPVSAGIVASTPHHLTPANHLSSMFRPPTSIEGGTSPFPQEPMSNGPQRIPMPGLGPPLAKVNHVGSESSSKARRSEGTAGVSIQTPSFGFNAVPKP